MKYGLISMLCDKVQAETDPRSQQKKKVLRNRKVHSQIKFKN